MENLPEISGSEFGVDPSCPMQLRARTKSPPPFAGMRFSKRPPEVKAGCVKSPKTVEQ